MLAAKKPETDVAYEKQALYVDLGCSMLGSVKYNWAVIYTWINVTYAMWTWVALGYSFTWLAKYNWVVHGLQFIYMYKCYTYITIIYMRLGLL